MLYYTGIEANRKAAKDRIKEMFKESKNKDREETIEEIRNGTKDNNGDCIVDLPSHGKLLLCNFLGQT